MKLKRLWEAIEVLAKIPNKKFNYSNYISENEGNCGTVCCWAGWYPKYLPQAGLMWTEPRSVFPKILNIVPTTAHFVKDALADYHLLKLRFIDYLFYGRLLEIELTPKGVKVWQEIKDSWKNSVKIRYPYICTKGEILSSKKQVLNAAEFLYYLLENKYIYE